MKNTHIDADDMERRMQFVDDLKELGADTSGIYAFLSDNSFEDFKYQAYREALRAKGVTTEHLAVEVGRAQAHDRASMEHLFQAHFEEDKLDTAALFVGCTDVREKIARLANLTESQIIMVYDDPNLEYVVRKYAASIMSAASKEMNAILDQALGKPIERIVTVNHEAPQLSALSTAELRALIGEVEEPEEIIAETEEVSQEGATYEIEEN